MATFAQNNFGYTAYATHRPTYPTSLFTEHLLPYHQGARHTLLDLGCGPGIVTRPLSAYFTTTIGTDPSPGMLSAAQELTPPTLYPTITYRASPAESLPFLPDASVDMVVAAQAAHWFDLPRFWAEMTRIVRPGGTIAVWGYKDFVIPVSPEASTVIARYTYGTDRLGPYWAQPGRSMVQGRQRFFVPPVGEWEDVQRWEYEGVHSEDPELAVLGYKGVVDEVDGLVKSGIPLLKVKWAMGAVESYARTWSAVHDWKVAHPNRVARMDGGEGDVMDEMFDEIRSVVPGLEGGGWKDKVVEIEFGHGVVCARRSG